MCYGSPPICFLPLYEFHVLRVSLKAWDQAYIFSCGKRAHFPLIVPKGAHVMDFYNKYTMYLAKCN